jgi:outer membrane lipoprotein SlyB
MEVCMRIIVLVLVILFVGCVATGERFRSDVYTSDQVNQQQRGKLVLIKKVLPAKVEVDNVEQKERTQKIGGLIGAITGGLTTGLTTKSRGSAAVGTAGGAAAGVVGGSIAPDKVIVEGVTIIYLNEDTGELVTSTQVGRTCEYVEGEKALMVTTKANETRIQPNRVCLEDK